MRILAVASSPGRWRAASGQERHMDRRRLLSFAASDVVNHKVVCIATILCQTSDWASSYLVGSDALSEDGLAALLPSGCTVHHQVWSELSTVSSSAAGGRVVLTVPTDG